MATLPRASKSPSNIRPQSEFDAGINGSTAWIEHLERASIHSAEEAIDDDEDGSHRPARALYDFDGKAEFRELSVEAGDELEVIKEDLADGWSLVKDASNEIGLLPRAYYTVSIIHRCDEHFS